MPMEDTNVRRTLSGNLMRPSAERPQEIHSMHNIKFNGFHHHVHSQVESVSHNEPQYYTSLGWKCIQLCVTGLSGVVFGVALEKGRVFEPSAIRDQMMFSRFVLLKMFLSASCTSMFVFSILGMVPATQGALSIAAGRFAANLDDKGVLSSVLGGTILGVGMTLSGACPGMLLAQVGAGTSGAVFTLLGGFCGVILYGILKPFIVEATMPSRPICRHFLHLHMGGSHFGLCLPLVSILGSYVYATELYAPWKSEVTPGGSGLLTSRAWPPYICGILIGLLQLPTVLCINQTLGSSTGYCTVVSVPLYRFVPYFYTCRFGIQNWSQVVYMGGAMLGGYLSSTASKTLGTVAGVNPMVGFFGGLCMLFGSRLAAGCTSGHGMSGMGLLSVLSLITVPAMFAGGIATAVIMHNM